MLKVECYSGYKVNERPLAFTIVEHDFKRSFQVLEVLDSWYGETADYFKVRADDDNIYLLKYDGSQNQWDLIFYQDPRRISIVQPAPLGVKPTLQHVRGGLGSPSSLSIH